MGDQGETVKSSLEERSCFPNNSLNNILSYFVDTETTSRWEKLTINNGMPPRSSVDPRPAELEGQ